MSRQDLPEENVYFQSYLHKAGVRFHYNRVDSTVRKGFSLSFYVVALIFIACTLLGPKSADFAGIALPLSVLSFVYLAVYAARYFYYCTLRRTLRKQQPVLAEAYAVVLLDRENSFLPALWRGMRLKRAVIYKESGTLKPRFFLGAASRRASLSFLPGLTVQVFTDKRSEKLYSVEEESAVRTMPAKARILGRLNLTRGLNAGTEIRDSVKISPQEKSIYKSNK